MQPVVEIKFSEIAWKRPKNYTKHVKSLNNAEGLAQKIVFQTLLVNHYVCLKFL